MSECFAKYHNASDWTNGHCIRACVEGRRAAKADRIRRARKKAALSERQAQNVHF